MSSEEKAAAPAKKKGGKMMLIIIALAVLAGGAGGAWFFMGKKSHADATPAPPKPPAYAPLEPFTVNLLPEGATQNYLQATLTLKVTDSHIANEVKQNIPEIRNRILFVLSSKKASELLTSEGKRKLAQEIMRETQLIISPDDIHETKPRKKSKPAKAKPKAEKDETADAEKTAEKDEEKSAEPSAKKTADADASASSKSKAGKAEKAAKAAADDDEDEEEEQRPRRKPVVKVMGVLFTSFIIQ